MICDLKMRAPTLPNPVTTADAEVGCIRGDAAILWKYFDQERELSQNVLQNIAACLLANLPGKDLGPANWKLKFSIRNGRPPRAQPEIKDALAAITCGDTIQLGLHLRSAQQLDEKTQNALAAAFDPCGTSKWQLKFVRRRGNQRSGIRAAIGKAFAADTANNLKADAKRRGADHVLAKDIYPKVRRAIEKDGLEHIVKVGKSTIRAGRAAIKKKK